LDEKVSAIIPAHNEAEYIGDTVHAAKAIPGVTEVIVVDDASTDHTLEIASSAGADKVISLNRNLGKGGALNAALRSASGSIILLLDGDLGASAVEAEKLLSPVIAGEADMTIAIFDGKSRNVESGQASRSGGFGTVVRTARFGIRLLCGQTIAAPLSGQRALRREIVDNAGGFASKFGVEVALTIDALRMGCRVLEVPVGMVHRPSGRDFKGFIHRGRQLCDVVRLLAGKAFSR